MSVTCHYIHFRAIAILVGSKYVRMLYVSCGMSLSPPPSPRTTPAEGGGSPSLVLGQPSTQTSTLSSAPMCWEGALGPGEHIQVCNRCCSAHSLIPGPTVCIVYTKEVFVAELYLLWCLYLCCCLCLQWTVLDQP